MKKSFGVYVMIGILMAVTAGSVLAQDVPASEGTKAPSPAAPQQSESGAVSQVKEIAIYGEVQAVNAAANTLSVQYYDYDSDSEKTAEVAVNADTKLESAKTVSDVKKGDWVDVTYVVSEGRNVAKMVSVEKEEPAVEPTGGMAGPAATDTSSDE